MNKKILLLCIALTNNLMQTAAFDEDKIRLGLDNQSNDSITFDSSITVPAHQLNIIEIMKGTTVQNFISQLSSENRTFLVMPPTSLVETLQYNLMIVFKNGPNPEVIYVTIPQNLPIAETQPDSDDVFANEYSVEEYSEDEDYESDDELENDDEDTRFKTAPAA